MHDPFGRPDCGPCKYVVVSHVGREYAPRPGGGFRNKSQFRGIEAACPDYNGNISLRRNAQVFEVGFVGYKIYDDIGIPESHGEEVGYDMPRVFQSYYFADIVRSGDDFPLHRCGDFDPVGFIDMAHDDCAHELPAPVTTALSCASALCDNRTKRRLEGGRFKLRN